MSPKEYGKLRQEDGSVANTKAASRPHQSCGDPHHLPARTPQAPMRSSCWDRDALNAERSAVPTHLPLTVVVLSQKGATKFCFRVIKNHNAS